MELLLEHVGKGIIVMLMIAMPQVLVAAGIGLVVGILQAVTQVQEQTIAAAPKILGVFIVIMALGGFYMNTIHKYFIESYNMAFNVVPRDEATVLPHTGTYTDFNGEKYYGEKMPGIKDAINSPGKLPISDKRLKESFIKTPGDTAYPPDFLEGDKIYNKK